MSIPWVVGSVDLSDLDAPLHLTINGYPMWSERIANDNFDFWGSKPKNGDMATFCDRHNDPDWSETRTFRDGQWEFTSMTCKAPPYAAPGTASAGDAIEPELLKKRVRKW